MLKIKLDTVLTDIKGQEVVDKVKDSKGKETEVKRTLKSDLLRLLGQQFPSNIIDDPKKYTWIYALSSKFNDKENEVEITDEQGDFLRDLVRKNKTSYMVRTQAGISEKEAPIFMPFEVGQLLHLLGEKE